MLHKDVNEALDNEIQSSKKPDLVVDFDKLKSPSFNKFEVLGFLFSFDFSFNEVGFTPLQRFDKPIIHSTKTESLGN